MSQFEPTMENIIRYYKMLSSLDQDEKQKANHFLLSLTDLQQTWQTSKSMISSAQDSNFRFLGAQILYQKIQKQLHEMDKQFKLSLKMFLFNELDSLKHNDVPIIDKLSSSIALISCSIFLQDWPLMIEDLIQFMRKTDKHLRIGLIILERVPEELKMTNRISQGIKNSIQTQMLKKQQMLDRIFQSILEIGQTDSTKRCLITLENWVKIGLPCMKYPNMIQKILIIILQNLQKFQIGSKVLVQILKHTNLGKFNTLNQLDPVKEREAYSEVELQSFKLIITFLVSNKSNFLNPKELDAQYIQLYVSIVKQLLLQNGFLLLQDIGFELLSIIIQVTNFKDYKLSYFCFQFWIDFSDKIQKLKINSFIKDKIWNVYNQLLQIVMHKIIIVNQSLMNEADLKQDETIDEADNMSFSQYRKQASSLIKYIYDYMVKSKEEQGSSTYFKLIVNLIQTDNPLLSKQTQLALFLLKAPLESMVNVYETNNIIQILAFLIPFINQADNTKIPVIVLGQAMNLIRDCTRQIKQKDQLFIECLKLVLNHINDDRLCHHSAYCFQILMETIKTLNDPIIAQNLIEFYQNKKFTKQIVLERMLEGLFNAIIKVPEAEKVNAYIRIILIQIVNRYQNIIMKTNSFLQSNQEGKSQLFLSLVQVKTLLDCFDGAQKQFRQAYKYQFIQLANRGFIMVNQILPLAIKEKMPYSNINQIGISLTIYKLALKTCEISSNIVNSAHVQALNNVITVLQMDTNSTIQYYLIINLLSECLMQAINTHDQALNSWLANHYTSFCDYFLNYFQNHQETSDSDLLKSFFSVQQALILYSWDIFFSYKNYQKILQISLHSLSKINQKNFHRKVINFIYLCVQNNICFSNKYQTILQYIFVNIPIINAINYITISRILIIIFQGTTLQQKQQVFINLLNKNQYKDIEPAIKNILYKFIAFAVESKTERYIKGVFMDLYEASTRKTSSDMAMQIQLRFSSWKRQYNKSLKEGKS